MTARQSQVLESIRAFIAENRYSPSIRQVAAMMGNRSPNAARQILDRLEILKVIRRAPGENGRRLVRSIVILDPAT